MSRDTRNTVLIDEGRIVSHLQLLVCVCVCVCMTVTMTLLKEFLRSFTVAMNAQLHFFKLCLLFFNDLWRHSIAYFLYPDTEQKTKVSRKCFSLISAASIELFINLDT